mmetsp:Transcript_22525/g.53890  ORF Transcript_22525/g.53890 Transcript_22525/m.53890 type:complete len:232 (+) Transcript_22525:1116-1811(+)
MPLLCAGAPHRPSEGPRHQHAGGPSLGRAAGLPVPQKRAPRDPQERGQDGHRLEGWPGGAAHDAAGQEATAPLPGGRRGRGRLRAGGGDHAAPAAAEQEDGDLRPVGIREGEVSSRLGRRRRPVPRKPYLEDGRGLERVPATWDDEQHVLSEDGQTKAVSARGSFEAARCPPSHLPFAPSAWTRSFLSPLSSLSPPILGTASASSLPRGFSRAAIGFLVGAERRTVRPVYV